MKRQAYRAYIKENCEELMVELLDSLRDIAQKYCEDGRLLTVSVFKWDRNIFLYYESVEDEVTPLELLGLVQMYLEEWPGECKKRYWIPMVDIYHCVDGEAVKSFRNGAPIQKTMANIARFKPEMLSSYIFYHYQYQEEKPGDFSKWCAIYLHENLAIIYGEDPDSPAPMPEKRTLYTSNTPPNWGEVMYLHFEPWEDVPPNEKLWRSSELLWFV